MADARTEARRLWQMMNRGGQMGMDVASDPLAYAGGASVVPPVDPSRMGGIVPIPTSWPELPEGVSPYRAEPYRPPPEGTPFNPDASGDITDFMDPMDASVVAPPRMPTANETVRGVMGPANERDAAFSRIHDAYYTGADFGYEQGWPERLNVPSEYIDLYMAVPDEAKQYARDNPTDAILQQFEEKYGFPLDVSIDISM
jgi:hypothetical protein